MNNTVCRPKIIVSADGPGIVSQAGAAAVHPGAAGHGPGAAAVSGARRWRAPRAVHYLGKMVADLAVALALGRGLPGRCGRTSGRASAVRAGGLGPGDLPPHRLAVMRVRINVTDVQLPAAVVVSAAHSSGMVAALRVLSQRRVYSL